MVSLPAFVFEPLAWDGVLDDQPIVSILNNEQIGIHDDKRIGIHRTQRLIDRRLHFQHELLVAVCIREFRHRECGITAVWDKSTTTFVIHHLAITFAMKQLRTLSSDLRQGYRFHKPVK